MRVPRDAVVLRLPAALHGDQTCLRLFIAFIAFTLCQVLSFGSAFNFLVGYHGSPFILFAFCFRFVVGFVLWRGCARG